MAGASGVPIEPMVVRKRSTLMWDTRYTQPGYAFGTEPNDFFVRWPIASPWARCSALAMAKAAMEYF